MVNTDQMGAYTLYVNICINISVTSVLDYKSWFQIDLKIKHTTQKWKILFAIFRFRLFWNWESFLHFLLIYIFIYMIVYSCIYSTICHTLALCVCAGVCVCGFMLFLFCSITFYFRVVCAFVIFLVLYIYIYICSIC